MQVLKSIEDKFNLLPLRLKIEFFLFPLIIVLTLVFFLFEHKNSSKIYFLEKEVDLENIKMNDNIVDILKKIEKYALENHINLHLVKKEKFYMKLKAFSTLKNRVLFLKYIEEINSFSKIETLEIREDSMVVEISFKKLYKKDKFIVDKKFDSFSKKEDNKNFILHAIVSDKVLINNKWLKLNDEINGFILKKIENNKITLENSYKKLILRLYKNENL